MRRLWFAVLALATSCEAAEAAGDPCGIDGAPSSNDQSRPTEYALGSTVVRCMLAGTRVHFHAFKVADDRTGGYLQIAVSDVGAGTVRSTVFHGAGTAELARFEAEGPGTALAFFLAVSPAQEYQVAIANQAVFKEPYTYTLSTVYTPVPDAFEPNDTIVGAAPLTVGVPVQAYLFAGRRRAEDLPTGDDDYYRFSAVSGSVTITIDDVPSDVAPRITLLGSNGSEAARVSSGVKGGRVVLRSAMPPGPADPVVLVAPWSDAPPSSGRGSALPDHFTHPYKLTVTQP